MNFVSLGKRLGSVFLLLSISILATSCATQTTATIRKPAPGGGFYVERIKIYKPLPTPKEKKSKKVAVVDDGSRWFGEGMKGSPRIKICLGEQRIYFFKGAELAGVSPMSSGREGMETRAGKYSITEKDADHKSSLFGDYVDKDGVVVKPEIDVRKDARPPGAKFDAAEMPFFMRIYGATGMHQGFLPGHAASHGCIRLPRKMAEIFFNESSIGTPVEIIP